MTFQQSECRFKSKYGNYTHMSIWN